MVRQDKKTMAFRRERHLAGKDIRSPDDGGVDGIFMPTALLAY